MDLDSTMVKQVKLNSDAHCYVNILLCC
jgi:hypothetical protein